GRRIARSAVSNVNLADSRLARTRGLRSLRRPLHRASRFDAHPALRRLAGPSAAEGLRVSTGVSWHKRAITPSHTRVIMATATTQSDPTIIEFDVRTDEMLVNMGPQHPSTHGVLRLVLRTDGEVISEVVPHLGYLHRCAEKIGENVLQIQFIPYTDRMDYLAGMNMNLAYSMAVEKLCGMKIPEKAQVIRVIIAELNRIASHLVGMGAYGLDLGTFSPFLYAFREREMILDLFEEVCGARLT